MPTSVRASWAWPAHRAGWVSGWYDHKCYYYYSSSYILRDSVKIIMTLSILLAGCSVRGLRLGINPADSGFTWSPSQTRQHLRQNNTCVTVRVRGWAENDLKGGRTQRLSGVCS